MKLDRRLSIAPMMRRTDRHFRYLMRIISPHALLYTEMISTEALIHGQRQRLLKHHPYEHPLAIQLGGNNPKDLATCAVISEDAGYDEVNLNLGCPSDRVNSGGFGACLISKPYLVAECIAQMAQRVRIPVTIKTRTGIDKQGGYEKLFEFIDCLKKAGCRTFIIHARQAWLGGLNPKQNRHIPPLQYHLVYQLKKDLPKLEIIINGGLTTKENILRQYRYVDGVMIGRAAYRDPYLLAKVENSLFRNEQTLPNRRDILVKFMEYVQSNLDQGAHLKHMFRHINGLFLGQPNARSYRRIINENTCKKNSIQAIQTAMEQLSTQ